MVFVLAVFVRPYANEEAVGSLMIAALQARRSAGVDGGVGVGRRQSKPARDDSLIDGFAKIASASRLICQGSSRRSGGRVICRP